ncbi:sulfotransferase [Sulfitobacter aestuariivivens]
MPNLFILGAQKAGTTYLAQVLSTHPDIFFGAQRDDVLFAQAGSVAGRL